MRILHVSSTIHPCFDDLVLEQKKEHSVLFVRLLLTDEDLPYKISRDHKGLIVDNVKRSQSYEYDNKLLEAFRQILRSYKPQLVHIHVFSGMSLLPILNAASGLRIKKILTLHDHSLFCVQGACLKNAQRCALDSLTDCDCFSCVRYAAGGRVSLVDFNRSREALCKRIIDQCDRIICPSQHQRDQLVKLFGREDRFIMLYYGTKPCPINGPRKTGSGVAFGYLGTLWQPKGVALIEAAIAKLKAHDFNVLMGVQSSGSPEDATILERLENNDKVTVKLNIKRRALYENFFSRIDYLIIPSLWNETGPMTLFEAFSYQVPVIISDVPSLTEKIKGNKSSFVFNDEHQLAEIMMGVIEQKISKVQDDIFPVIGIREYAQEVASVYDKALAAVSRGLYLRLGVACNSHCEFCVTAENSGSKSTLSFHEVRNMLEQGKTKYDYLVLTGGEPTIRKDFLRIVDLAYKSGYEILLQTNARIFSFEEYCKRVAKYNIRYTTHIDGPTAEVHDAVQQAPGSFQQTVAGIRNLQKLNSNILVKMLITQTNHKHLFATGRFIAELGIKDIWFVFLTPYGAARANFDKVVPTFSETLPHLREAVRWLKENTQARITLEGFPHCCLDPDFYPLMMEGAHAVGSLDGVIPQNRDRIYNSQRERMDVQKQKFIECGDCSYEKECEGVYREYVYRRGREEFKPVAEKWLQNTRAYV